MMKRCTVSSCRRMFRVENGLTCPYCGKVYRYQTSGVVLRTCPSNHKGPVFRAIRAFFPIGLKEVKALFDSMPCNLPLPEKRRMQAYIRALKKAGANIQVRR